MNEKKKLLFLGLFLLFLVFLIFYFYGDNDFNFSMKRDAAPRDGDGYTYDVVEIGDQVWFAENLRYAGHSEGESYCYENEDENCETYGRLYTLDAGMEACPNGWVVPTDEDWDELEVYIDDLEMIGAKLKSETLWDLDFEDVRIVEEDQEEEEEVVKDFTGLDEYGFNALPSGHYVEEYFYDLNLGAFFWSSTILDHGAAWARVLRYDSNEMNKGNFGPEHAFSVRCIKEKTE